eukprot:3941644-Rhodomonas_salina.18
MKITCAPHPRLRARAQDLHLGLMLRSWEHPPIPETRNPNWTNLKFHRREMTQHRKMPFASGLEGGRVVDDAVLTVLLPQRLFHLLRQNQTSHCWREREPQSLPARTWRSCRCPGTRSASVRLGHRRSNMQDGWGDVTRVGADPFFKVAVRSPESHMTHVTTRCPTPNAGHHMCGNTTLRGRGYRHSDLEPRSG